jgi:competence protein ComEC
MARGSVSAVAGQALGQLARLQVALLFGLLPLTVLLFGRIAIAAPPVNLIAVPVFSFLTVPSTLGAMLLDGPLQFAGNKLLLVALHSLRGIEFLIALVAGIPAADVVLPAVAGTAWLYLFLAVAWVVLPPAWPGRWIALLGVIALFLHEPSRPPEDCADVDVLDAGQGLAVFVQTRSSDVLYDTGPGFRNGGSAAETQVLPFLASRGVKRLDVLVISHGDLDHSGGTEAVVADLEPRRTYTSEPLDNSRLLTEACRAGQLWQSDGTEFHFLHPPAGTFPEGNDASCVLMIATGEHRLLLTGDIERLAESWLVQHGDLPTVDVVVVPHHGSRTSSSLPFVRALSPKLAIVSASFGNRWGFPKPDVVERWSAAGARVLDTASAGAVSMRLCAGAGMTRLKRHRTDARRPWHE